MLKPLFNYQQTALNLALNHDRFLLALDMGLGKTLTALYWLFHHKQTLSYNVLIVVNAQKLGDWQTEATPFKFPAVRIINQPKGVETLVKSLKTPNQIFIISYQKLINVAKKFPQFMNQPWILILDESQALKNPKTQTSRLFLKHNDRFKKVLLLSGDPISTGYENLYVQMKVLKIFPPDFKYANFAHHFLKLYQLPNVNVRIIVGYKNVATLKGLLSTRSYFLKTVDAIGLPVINHHKKKLPNCNLYNEFATNAVVKIETADYLADNHMAQLHGLRQLANGCVAVWETLAKQKIKYAIINRAKLDYVNNLITESTYNFSIFYHYKSELYALRELLKPKQKTGELAIFEINGAKNELAEATKLHAHNQTQLSPQRIIVLIQYQSGARGIDGLQNYVFNQIYFGPTTSGELFKQSLKRIHRIGQTQRVNYYYLLTQKSIDEQIYRAVENSQDYTNELFKRDYPALLARGNYGD